jgi:hypothetical protein
MTGELEVCIFAVNKQIHHVLDIYRLYWYCSTTTPRELRITLKKHLRERVRLLLAGVVKTSGMVLGFPSDLLPFFCTIDL